MDTSTSLWRVFAAQSSGFPVENLFEPNAGAVGRTSAANPFKYVLHLLRETSVSQAADASDEVLKIPRRNIETMRKLGQEHILKRLQTLDAER